MASISSFSSYIAYQINRNQEVNPKEFFSFLDKLTKNLGEDLACIFYKRSEECGGQWSESQYALVNRTRLLIENTKATQQLKTAEEIAGEIKLFCQDKNEAQIFKFFDKLIQKLTPEAQAFASGAIISGEHTSQELYKPDTNTLKKLIENIPKSVYKEEEKLSTEDADKLKLAINEYLTSIENISLEDLTGREKGMLAKTCITISYTGHFELVDFITEKLAQSKLAYTLQYALPYIAQSQARLNVPVQKLKKSLEQIEDSEIKQRTIDESLYQAALYNSADSINYLMPLSKNKELIKKIQKAMGIRSFISNLNIENNGCTTYKSQIEGGTLPQNIFVLSGDPHGNPDGFLRHLLGLKSNSADEDFYNSFEQKQKNKHNGLKNLIDFAKQHYQQLGLNEPKIVLNCEALYSDESAKNLKELILDTDTSSSLNIPIPQYTKTYLGQLLRTTFQTFKKLDSILKSDDSEINKYKQKMLLVAEDLRTLKANMQKHGHKELDAFNIPQEFSFDINDTWKLYTLISDCLTSIEEERIDLEDISTEKEKKSSVVSLVKDGIVEDLGAGEVYRTQLPGALKIVETAEKDGLLENRLNKQEISDLKTCIKTKAEPTEIIQNQFRRIVDLMMEDYSKYKALILKQIAERDTVIIDKVLESKDPLGMSLFNYGQGHTLTLINRIYDYNGNNKDNAIAFIILNPDQKLDGPFTIFSSMKETQII